MKYTPLKSWPLFSCEERSIESHEWLPEIGVDLEWDPKTTRLTILGLSDGEWTVTVNFDKGIDFFRDVMARKPRTLIGHNIVSADFPLLRERGIETDLSRAEDTIIRFYLSHAHLCKMKGKATEEEGERKGRGFMGLGTMLALCTNLPYYKTCRGANYCEKNPCPQHHVFGYNAMDTLGPVLALPELKRLCASRGVEHLYPLHVQLSDMLAGIRDRGIMVNRGYISHLRGEFVREKETVAEQFPLWEQGKGDRLNPESPGQVKTFFKKRYGLSLANAQEATIEQAADEHPEIPELQLIREWKQLGDGPDRWFGERYLAGGDTLHPSLSIFTSSGRLMGSNPNMQNVTTRRVDKATGEKIGKKVRRAVIARPGHYWIKADYKNAENRCFLYLAGYTEIPNVDFHTWMAQIVGIGEKDAFAIRLGSARNAAKSVTHATDYLEGLSLKTSEELRSPKIQREIAAGARLVFEDWTFNGKIVTFTGINLARRAFGEASLENRKRALDATAKYFAAFSKIRELQKRITKQLEREGAVQPPHGYYTLCYDRDEEKMKTAASIWGSQPVAHLTKIALLRARDDGRLNTLLQVHDELDFEADRRHSLKKVAAWVREYMCFETPEMPGFSLPVDVSYGPPIHPVTREKAERYPSNWADQEEVT
jgi:DNA polymerase I-like protein with 3'-5' exonuclease and polymerase domains